MTRDAFRLRDEGLKPVNLRKTRFCTGSGPRNPEPKATIGFDVLALCSRTIRGAERLLNERIASASDNPRIIVQNDFDRHFSEQWLHPALVEERLHENRIPHLWHDFGRDAPAKENAPCGHEMQSTVSGLRSINTDEN